jgi:hypothetical protein
LLQGISLSSAQDVGLWALTKSGTFSSKSLYHELTNSGVKDVHMMDMWKSNMPMKIKIFVWMCFRGRIQVAADFKAKNWPGDPCCKLCGELETAGHLIFNCPLSHFNWWWIKEAMGWERPPVCFDDFITLGLNKPGAHSNLVGWAIFGAIAWSIWLARNDLVFNNKTCGSPFANIFKMISFLSEWTVLIPARRRTEWMKMMDRVKLAAKTSYFLVRPRGGIS